MKIVSRAAMQTCDQHTINELGVPALLLMETAGAAIARYTEDHLQQTGDEAQNKPLVAILCGPGNNGGDGLSAARHLQMNGVAVHIFTPYGVRSEAARQMESIAQSSHCEFLEIGEFRADHYDIVLDALFGIGLKDTPDRDFAELVLQINAAEAVLSVDIPSGIDADTGEILGAAVQADLTVALQLPKTGHFQFPGSYHTGALYIEPIGIHTLELQAGYPVWVPFAIPSLPPRFPYGHKGSFGHVLAVGGCRETPGAVRLAALAAHGSGAGKVSVLTPMSNQFAIQCQEPELMLVAAPDENHLGHASLKSCLHHPAGVHLIGTGAGRHQDTHIFIQQLLEKSAQPLVLDADGIHALQSCKEEAIQWLRQREGQVVLTPHLGEFGHLMGLEIPEVEARALELAGNFAREWKVVLLLKSSHHILACPDGTVLVCGEPNAVLAKGGTGDFLSGLIAGLMAGHLAAEDAALQACLLLRDCARRVEQERSSYGGSVQALLQVLPEVLATAVGPLKSTE